MIRRVVKTPPGNLSADTPINTAGMVEAADIAVFCAAKTLPLSSSGTDACSRDWVGTAIKAQEAPTLSLIHISEPTRPY